MNTIETNVLLNNPGLITNKPDKSLHGIGLNSVNDIVKKYKGMISFDQKSDKFYVYISLNKCISWHIYAFRDTHIEILDKVSYNVLGDENDFVSK